MQPFAVHGPSVPFSPHSPIAGTKANAKVAGDEVGQRTFKLDAAATIAALFREGRLGTQEVIVSPDEISPGQVSDISAQEPALGQHGFGAQADSRSIPLRILSANDPVVTRGKTSTPGMSDLNTTGPVRALAVIGPAYKSTYFVVRSAQEILADVGRVICESSV
ncbi:hypothetical protein [Bradyrhizobium sp. STM 3561]|uniref:hypothetical protein n=1 Tax=unclassified Bradyrhizobium TaxID=2631580 RepID=UPI00388DED80